jgi:hypothetical protein
MNAMMVAKIAIEFLGASVMQIIMETALFATDVQPAGRLFQTRWVWKDVNVLWEHIGMLHNVINVPNFQPRQGDLRTTRLADVSLPTI